MKIGILTFWWSEDNYGQILQCYALQKYLRDLGHEVFLIKYDPRNDADSYSLKEKIRKAMNPQKFFFHIEVILAKQINKKKHKLLLEEQNNHPRYFSSFRDKYIIQSEQIYYSYSELKQNFPEADVYIVGSDQVWNPNLSSLNGLNAYFLNFGSKETKRISYAASFGVRKLDKDKKIMYKQFLTNFDAVSVREKSGVALCEKCGCDNVTLVSDPTLLLDENVYKKIYKENSIRKPLGKYLLLYILGNKYNFSLDKVYEFAKSKNLEVVFVTGNSVFSKKEKFYATVPEWLYLVDNAEYVITNSFHCCVFSSIFNTKFGVIKLCGEHKEMNDRFISLFNLLNIEERFILEKDFSRLESDYFPRNKKCEFLDNLFR